MSVVDIKNVSLFSFGVDPNLVKLIEKLFKKIDELQNQLREQEKDNLKDKLRIKDLEIEIKILEEKLSKK